MNLESEILKENSKRQVLKIAKWIGNNPARFKLLMELFLYGEPVTTQRTAWTVGYYGEKYPELIKQRLPSMLEKMNGNNVHCAVKRNVVRTLQYIENPRSQLCKAINICFDEMASLESPIAVRVYSMYVLEKVAKQEAGIRNKLRVTIEQMLPYSSGGIIASAKKVLKQLAELNRNK